MVPVEGPYEDGVIYRLQGYLVRQPSTYFQQFPNASRYALWLPEKSEFYSFQFQGGQTGALARTAFCVLPDKRMGLLLMARMNAKRGTLVTLFSGKGRVDAVYAKTAPDED